MNEQQLSRKDLINATLWSFKITTYDFEEIQGAAVTLYKFRPQLGVRVSKIRGLKVPVTPTEIFFSGLTYITLPPSPIAAIT